MASSGSLDITNSSEGSRGFGVTTNTLEKLLGDEGSRSEGTNLTHIFIKAKLRPLKEALWASIESLLSSHNVMGSFLETLMWADHLDLLLYGRHFARFDKDGEKASKLKSLIKCVYKVIAKTLVKRQAMVIDSIIGPNQSALLEDNGVTRPKKYFELSPTEAIQFDCDIKVTNIILQGLPSEVYALVSNHKVAKELWERIQLLMQGTSLTKQERECKLYDEFVKFAYKKGKLLLQFSRDFHCYSMT
ncbi:hypothetical protein Tco_0891584 [Tanacetum coccineum]|uniref:Integrase, catalytic region, zinc finger, CCHC-type, peptidase aspartic, catalytic n=1 Tax=Tanacetum coccineum TaxID=301880 RepID=A0ABQ5C694_9ASTR